MLSLTEIKLRDALQRYVSIDNDERAGCIVDKADKDECREQAMEELARVAAKSVRA